jgi:hypothetical protein
MMNVYLNVAVVVSVILEHVFTFVGRVRHAVTTRIVMISLNNIVACPLMAHMPYAKAKASIVVLHLLLPVVTLTSRVV